MSIYSKSSLPVKALFLAQPAISYATYYHCSKHPLRIHEDYIFLSAGIASVISLFNFKDIQFKKLLKIKKQFMTTEKNLLYLDFCLPFMRIEKNRLDWLDIKIDSYLPFSNKEIHSYIKKNNLRFKLETTQDYITFLKDKNNFIFFSQFDSLITKKMKKTKVFDLALYKNKNLPRSIVDFLAGKYEGGFPSSLPRLIINSKFLKKDYRQLYNDRLIMNIDIHYLQYLYKLYKDGIEFFEQIGETKKVLSYESFLEWLNLSIEKRTFTIMNFRHILFMPLIYVTVFSSRVVYFPWHLFLIASELNPLKSLIMANILNQFTKVAWMSKHPEVYKEYEENQQNEIFASYDQLEPKYKKLLPYFKENYNTKDQDIFEKNRTRYMNFMHYIILDKTKIKIKNLQGNQPLNERYIGYKDVKNEYDLYTSLVKNCKIYCTKDCRRGLGQTPCRFKDYLFFGAAHCSDIYFFDNKGIFDKENVKSNGQERTVGNLTFTDNNVYLNENKNPKEIIDAIEKELDEIEKELDEIEKELKKPEKNKDLKKILQKILLYFF